MGHNLTEMIPRGLIRACVVSDIQTVKNTQPADVLMQYKVTLNQKYYIHLFDLNFISQ